MERYRDSSHVFSTSKSYRKRYIYTTRETDANFSYRLPCSNTVIAGYSFENYSRKSEKINEYEIKNALNLAYRIISISIMHQYLGPRV